VPPAGLDQSVGLVVPAYEPDVPTLRRFVETLRDEVSPTAVRIELDAPDGLDLSFPTFDDVTVNAVNGRRGKGLAITQGFEALDADVLAFADADGSTPAYSVAAVVDAAAETNGVAVGSRRHPNAHVQTHQSVVRRTLGDAFAAMSRLLLPFGLYDYQCGAKALTSDAWRAVRPHLTEPGFAWDIELLTAADALGYPIAEVPVTWIDDPASTVDTVDAVRELSRTVLRARRRHGSIGRGSDPSDRRPLVEY